MVNKKIAIVCADFNDEITSVMLETALQRAKKQQLEVVKVIKVPGCFDIPYALKKIILDKSVDGIITLGAVLQGDTDHDIIVADHCARKCSDLSVEYNIPIALGVIGPRVSWENALKRREEYAIRAVDAVKMLMEI
ncbi:6,7-dimethyl-8-ribityllumazine synthase [Candidatus Woesearchaeota archaeon]|nr:6,7-dimethyl-8-ribityllumazine synthase [Candidatus Woesearchaeota archaeon]